MTSDSDLHPRVYPTVDGERSSAGTNYGDWRPHSPPRPHGYDFEKRFEHQAPLEVTAPDGEYRQLREQHARELDARVPGWRQARGPGFAEDDFSRWRAARADAAMAPDEPGHPREPCPR